MSIRRRWQLLLLGGMLIVAQSCGLIPAREPPPTSTPTPNPFEQTVWVVGVADPDIERASVRMLVNTGRLTPGEAAIIMPLAVIVSDEIGTLSWGLVVVFPDGTLRLYGLRYRPGDMQPSEITGKWVGTAYYWSMEEDAWMPIDKFDATSEGDASAEIDGGVP